MECINNDRSRKRIENYDFIKGIAILFVILHHVMMVYAELPLHTVFTIKNAVPLFIIVTILLRYKKLERCSLSQYWRTIVNELLKVFLPFCISLILLFAYIHPNFNQIIKFQIGWGSYYPLVYAQLIIMAPVAYKICKKNITLGILLILSFCVVTEILFSYFGIPLWFYRLLFTRYAFLYVISYLLLEKQILSKYKWLMILFAILGGLFIYVHCYFNVNLFFYPGWIGSKFPRDFISLVWFIILFKLCDILHYKIKKVITYFGEKSYDIFIIQMMYFCFKLPVDNIIVSIILSYTIILVCSYFWGLVMKKFINLLPQW